MRERGGSKAAPKNIIVAKTDVVNSSVEIYYVNHDFVRNIFVKNVIETSY